MVSLTVLLLSICILLADDAQSVTCHANVPKKCEFLLGRPTNENTTTDISFVPTRSVPTEEIQKVNIDAEVPRREGMAKYQRLTFLD